ncbi:MAG: ATP-binding protein [Porticoccus sp.]|nr:ATP-binding protein [Porticoccus sp.]
MTNKRLFNNSIHQRFLAVALLPLLFITCMLNFYIIDARKNDLTKSLNDAGEMASNYLSTISDFALYSHNIPLLTTTAKTVVRLPDVTGIAYLDPSHELILTLGDFPNPATPSAADSQPIQQDHFLYFKKPVYLSGIEFTDYKEESPELASNADLVGWVIIVMDQTPLLRKQREIIATSLWLSIVGFVIATILTYFLSLMLIAPIRQLTATIKKMASGDLDARAKIGTKDELAILANGINQLAESVTEGKSNLEDRIRVSTHQLQETLSDLKKKNQQLEIAREDADTANVAKSDFLARMSHELRTPITSIQGFVRLLETSNLPDGERHYCQIIDQASLHLLTLIDDILAFSKLQSETVVLAHQPINLAECTEQIVALFSPQAQYKGLDLVVDFAPNLLLYRLGDPVRIQQILSNLIANAIKFCNTGGIYITLKTNDKQDIIIRVRDTGIGILKESQDLLFNAFVQADTSISRRYGGTGLGLSIVKSLVDLMNGKISLESSVDEGSCFQIILPLPLSDTQPNWQIDHKSVVLSGYQKPLTKAVIHALERFGINNTIVTDKDHLIDKVAVLNPDDRVIFCPPSGLPKDFDMPKYMLEIRAATPAKLILIASQFNFYQQFNAKQRAELYPIAFLSSPPPLIELMRALKKKTTDEAESITATPDIQLLDGVNILIAEDNQFTRLLLDTLLSKLGAYCTLTSNGNEALAACQHDHFDIFLVDVHMPMKNGIETICALRQSNNENADIPTLAVTADILQQEKKALFEVGANGLLIKPLDEHELLEKICQQLNIVPPQKPIPPAVASSDISAKVFQQEVNNLLGGAREQLASGSITELKDTIHQLLGIAGVFKLSELETRVKQLHEQVKVNHLERVTELLDQISNDIDNTIF